MRSTRQTWDLIWRHERFSCHWQERFSCVSVVVPSFHDLLPLHDLALRLCFLHFFVKNSPHFVDDISQSCIQSSLQLLLWTVSHSSVELFTNLFPFCTVSYKRESVEELEQESVLFSFLNPIPFLILVCFPPLALFRNRIQYKFYQSCHESGSFHCLYICILHDLCLPLLEIHRKKSLSQEKWSRRLPLNKWKVQVMICLVVRSLIYCPERYGKRTLRGIKEDSWPGSHFPFDCFWLQL